MIQLTMFSLINDIQLSLLKIASCSVFLLFISSYQYILGSVHESTLANCIFILLCIDLASILPFTANIRVLLSIC